MHSTLTNLLPPDRQRTDTRDYFIRLGTLACLLLTAAVIVHAALLVPSYLYLQEQVTLERTRIAELDAALASSGEGELSTRVSRLKEDGARLLTLLASPSAAEAARAVLEVPRTGITIQALTFHAPDPEGRMTVTGTAATRESLRQYAFALSQLPFAKGADLPLSAYAKESAIPFTITLTGTLAP